MEIPNITLAYQIKEMHPFVQNSFIQKFQQIQQNIYKIKLHSKTGNHELVLALPSTFYLTNLKLPTIDQKGFQKNISDTLENQKILSFQQHFFDRVIEIQVPKGYLILELFADGNIIFTDNERKIVAVLNREEWSTRTLKRGETYSFPPAKKIQPLNSSFQEFYSELKKFEKDIARFLIMECNVASFIAEEILFELKINKTTIVDKISEKQAKIIFEKMNDFYSLKKPLSPVIIQEKNKEFLLPFFLSSRKESPLKEFNSFSTAFDESFKEKFNQSAEDTESQSTELNALQESMNKQLRLKEEFTKQIAENEKKGTFIYEKFTEIQELMQAIERAKGKQVSEKEILSALKKHSKLVKDLQLKKGKLVLEM